MSSMSLPATPSWCTESLRLTVFPTPGDRSSIQDWWQELLDEPPEKLVSTPKTGETQLQGTFNGQLLLLSAHAMRIDLRHSTKPTSAPTQEFSTLGPYEGARQVFCDLVLRGLSLETFPRIQRLAFGAILTKPVESLKSGYEALRVYLPAVEISTNSSDLLYQINRRRPSGVIDSLALNRLSKWSVQTVQGVLMRGDGKVVQTTTEYSCRTELDVNSVPEQTDELPRDVLRALFGECVGLADELATKGDVP